MRTKWSRWGSLGTLWGFVFLLGWLVIGLAVQAQLPTGTISGVVKDASGAVMPGASITVTNTDTGLTRMGTAAADGTYKFLALPVGTYEIRVEHPGFQRTVQSGLMLNVGQEAVMNFSLQVGAVEQTIAVTAEAPLVNTTSGSLGGLVDEQSVADLPLNGRNYVDLTLLQPGISQHRNVSIVGQMTGTWFSSNGAPVRSNNFLLDGAIMQTLYGTGAASMSNTTLGVEGIREYRVVTNAFTAEYGLTMGSQMTIVTKNGTNSFHGSLFEYFRNSALDARNFFDRKTAATPRRLPAFTRNQYGGSFGGPIKKDKTFFFVVYEGLKERLGVTRISNVIPASAKVDGGLVPQIAPVVKPLLALYPDPNLPGNQYTFSQSQPTNEQYGQIRIDQTISVNDTLFGRHTIDDAQLVQPINYPQFIRDSSSRSQYATLSETHIFTPSLLNTARFSFSRTPLLTISPSGISGPQFSFVPGEEIGSITIPTVTTLSADGPSPGHKKQNIFTWSDDLFYTRGRHTLKFGTLINRYQQFVSASTNNRGGATFPSLTAFLLARPSVISATTPGSVSHRTYHYTSFGFYAQDDLRVSPTWTLNLGLRYEFLTEFQEVRGHGAALRDIQHDAQTTLGRPFENPSLKNLSPRFGFAWDVRGDGKTAVRGGFGLLYDLGNLGSALLVGAQATPPFSSLSTVTNPPTLTLPFFFPPEAAGKALRTVDYLFQQPHMLQYNLTLERQLPFDMAVTLAYAGSRGINIAQTVEGNPTVPQGIPEGRSCVVPATPPPFRADGPKCWTGSDPRTNPNWNDIEFKTAGGNSWYNSLQLGLSKRLGQGLQFQSAYTWSKTLDETQSQLGADNSASSSTGVDPSNRKVSKGLAAFHVAHNWKFNAIYRLPAFTSAGGVTEKLLNGWWVSNIISLQSGYPFEPALGSNRSRSKTGGGGAGLDRPDLLPGRQNEDIVGGTSPGCLGVTQGQKLGGPDRYFDPCAFAIPPIGFLGTAGRNILIGPGFANFDFSVVKDTALGWLGESGKLEFRAEFFNLLNRANFSIPSSRNVFSASADVEPALATAGRITSTTNASRQVQLALKLVF